MCLQRDLHNTTSHYRGYSQNPLNLSLRRFPTKIKISSNFWKAKIDTNWQWTNEIRPNEDVTSVLWRPISASTDQKQKKTTENWRPLVLERNRYIRQIRKRERRSTENNVSTLWCPLSVGIIFAPLQKNNQMFKILKTVEKREENLYWTQTGTTVCLLAKHYFSFVKPLAAVIT